MTKKPEFKKPEWKPGQEHPKRKPRSWGGFNEAAREYQKTERDQFGRRKREE